MISQINYRWRAKRMEKQLTINSGVFEEARIKMNQVIQQTMKQLETGNFSKGHILVTLDIRPTFKDDEQMLIDVDHKVTSTLKNVINTEKDTTNSDTPIKNINGIYVEGDNPQMSLLDQEEEQEETDQDE